MDRLNITGFWSGTYWYYEPYELTVPFLANLDEEAGRLSGMISEPNTIVEGGNRLEAFIIGSREQYQVEFAKVYDGAGELAHRVDYFGMLADDGLTVTGRWILEDWTGGFSMSRQAMAATEIEAEQELQVIDAEERH